MNKHCYLIVLSLLFYFTSCSENSNPVNNKHSNECSISGLEIEFADTCSYKFITTFMSGFDSVVVTETFLGSTFYSYADSADDIYWLNYYENDSTIQRLIVYTSNDSLILKIKLTGEKSSQEEKQRFLAIKNLEIIKIKEYPKLVYIDVPENTESEWASLFEQNLFITHAHVIGVCYAS